nr:hypothetical protein [Tanacetum cinerariifolium]
MEKYCGDLVQTREDTSTGILDHMEHLVVHLSYEARFGGPVQYRCMYPFERVRQNDDGSNVNEKEDVLSIFQHPVRPSGNSKRRYLNDNEYETAIFYVIQYCEEIQPFFSIFEGEVKLEMPNITNTQLVDVTKKRKRIRSKRDKFEQNQAKNRKRSEAEKSLK